MAYVHWPEAEPATDEADGAELAGRRTSTTSRRARRSKKTSQVGRPPAGPNGQKTSSYPQLSARLPPETVARVRELSRALGVPQWRIVADAVDEYSKRHL